MQKGLSTFFNVQNWALLELVWLALFMYAGTVVTVFTRGWLFKIHYSFKQYFYVMLAAKVNIWTHVFGSVDSLGLTR
jgi:hypothetical protein